MARRRKGEPVHGWVILDKPAGMTSAQATGRVRRLFNAAKAGHAGTLDPLATGVLPVALGEATKTVSHVQNGAKTYAFTVRFGEERDTGDAEGAVVATSSVRPGADALRAAAQGLTGTLLQAPPAFSALKVGGQRASDLARAGRPPTLAARTVFVRRFELVGSDGAEADFVVECGKGTYIRALVRDLCTALGTRGHVAALRRLAVGPMTAESAFSLEALEQLVHSPAPNGVLLPVETALADIPALPLSGTQAALLRSGQPIRVPAAVPGTVCAMEAGRPVALANVQDGEVRAVRVFTF